MKAIDLFCGAGGLTRGLMNAGIDVLAGVDIDGNAADTYEYNNERCRFIRSDLRELKVNTLADQIKRVHPSELLVAGCAPCMPFSKQRRGGYKGDPDATLLRHFGDVVAKLRPAWVMVENVPGLADVPGFSTLRRLIRRLGAMGYGVTDGVVNACDYGVPQHRRRYVLLASRTAKPMLPGPQYGSRSKPYETVRGWISHFPSIEAGEEHPTVPNHVASDLSDTNRKRIGATPANGGGRESWPDQLKLPCHEGLSHSFTDVYGRMWWDRVAPTLTGRCNSLSNGRFGHPEQNRAISLREAASLQTFPENYVFFGPRSRIARQIGNAVPVRLAEALGRSILEATQES